MAGKKPMMHTKASEKKESMKMERKGKKSPGSRSASAKWASKNQCRSNAAAK